MNIKNMTTNERNYYAFKDACKNRACQIEFNKDNDILMIDG